LTRFAVGFGTGGVGSHCAFAIDGPTIQATQVSPSGQLDATYAVYVEESKTAQLLPSYAAVPHSYAWQLSALKSEIARETRKISPSTISTNVGAKSGKQV
jgi:hypothetical protein